MSLDWIQSSPAPSRQLAPGIPSHCAPNAAMFEARGSDLQASGLCDDDETLVNTRFVHFCVLFHHLHADDSERISPLRGWPSSIKADTFPIGLSVLVSFCSCGQESMWRKDLCVIRFLSEPITEGSQGRNSGRSLEQRSWSNTGSSLACALLAFWHDFPPPHRPREWRRPQ